MATPTSMAKKKSTVDGVFPTKDDEESESPVCVEVAVGSVYTEATASVWAWKSLIVDIIMFRRSHRSYGVDTNEGTKMNLEFRGLDEVGGQVLEEMNE